MNVSENIPHNGISKSIVRSIGHFWQCHELEDFIVSIDGENISCHSFILASCSDFFRSLLRSNMKEKQEMKVELQNISIEIFHLILKSLYTGCDVLSKDNVLDVWAAVHRLQISFLIEHCEEFVLENLSPETIELYKNQADFLHSERVCNGVFENMLQNFMTLRKTEAFLRLNFGDILDLVESDNLVVTSEDVVINFICEWVSYGDIDALKEVIENNEETVSTSAHSSPINSSLNEVNSSRMGKENVDVLIGNDKDLDIQAQDDSNNSLTQASFVSSETQKESALSAAKQTNERLSYLFQLLKATRYCLLSEACIVNLYQKKWTLNNLLVKDLLFEASVFKASRNLNGFWPNAAIYRNCSDQQHLGVVCFDEYRIAAYDFKKNVWFYVSNSRKHNFLKLTVFNSQLYACTNEPESGDVFLLRNNEWFRVRSLLNKINLFLSHGRYIYIFSSDNATVNIFDPHNPYTTNTYEMNSVGNAKYAISFCQNILVFETVDKNRKVETSVHCWDTENNIWSQIMNMEFSASNMTSFRNDQQTYILDELGRLWQIKNSNTIQFTFLGQLWSFPDDLKGAVLFRKTLYLFGRLEKQNVKKIDQIFNRVEHLTAEGEFYSNVVPLALLESELLKDCSY